MPEATAIPRDERARVEQWTRTTVLHGPVVVYAQGFTKERGRFHPGDDTWGAFCITASRREIIVERATLRTEWEQLAFARAMALATAQWRHLTTPADGPLDRAPIVNADCNNPPKD